MAQIESVYNATQTEAFMDDEVLNPDITEDRARVNITLVLDGVTLDLSDIYDMLNTQFGTVTSDEVPTRNHYVFNLSA